ncbi:MAG TPA: M13 family metallopeptidase [Candidatus Angelobacter sp.]|nr:M13 family metallopeptidase [Candidatus Angelobacter sp.]
MRMFRFLIAATLALAGAGAQVSSAQTKAAGTEPTSSLDLSALDKSADPCVDFYQFSCGGWLKNSPIPPDQSSWGRFNELAERNRVILREILESAAKPGARTPNEQKIGDYYASCMDEDTIAQKGVAVLKPVFDQINSIQDKSQLATLAGHLHRNGVEVLFGFGSGSDFKNAKQVIAQADQGGLSLPDRDYYLKDDPKSVELRKAFVEHVTNMFELLGDSPQKARAAATAVMNIETALAKGSMDRVERRDPDNIYHKLSKQQWQALTPTLSWPKYLAEVGAPDFSSLNVATPDFFKALNQVVDSASLEDLKTYFRWHFVHAHVQYLPKPLIDESFNFYGKTLRGAKELQARWKRCVSQVDGNLGEALGQVFVEKHFPPEAKARTLKMVQALENALRADIQGLDWMSDTTKKQALIKLQAIQNKIGYPDQFRDYSKLKIVRGDALGNSLRANAFEFNRQLNKIGHPLDKKEWQMTPPTVNAYYDASENNINFPAGILQPPFYDFHADDALNFGAIGAVIGHELTHGFDDEGAKFDADGNLKSWWTPQDEKAFQARTQCLVDEYDGFVAVDDVHVRGKLTLGENTADNGGVRIALMALLASMANAGKTPEKIDGFTPEQRLFLGWGQIWCQNMTEQMSRLLALNNEHSPGRYRVNGVLSNMPEFQKAWGCKPGQPMVRANACHVW